ncbi:hypothetical protein JG687_00011167 [Phytophthora cactorum]|uniref:Wbp11/ELF5/Saf1 N-terminal domain-containing protein n=1 Tax=Phytophthora cactorum TaxID=29920 RepID=A0A8T1U770_9STRA|nr:hypothetical protein JG687_00011167 [Phytophthora cactorum]
MAKSLNPMEAYRREQKKKELKKHRVERQKDKQAKLSVMDPVEIREQLKNLERQVAANPTDGPTRKRKQELEDTLRAVVKKQKELADEERKKQANAPPPPPMSMAELTQANKEKFQNPENSIYYHPTLNPFGAPPPGKPQVYRNMPSDVTEMQTGNATTVDREDDHVVAPYPTTDENEDDSVVAPYPPPEDEEMDEEAAERAAESRAQLRSLVPVALRVQRQVAAPPSSSVGNAPPVPAPRRPVPAPPTPAPRPPVGVAPPPPPPRPIAPKPADNSSVSKEFDAFMEEVKELL